VWTVDAVVKRMRDPLLMAFPAGLASARGGPGAAVVFYSNVLGAVRKLTAHAVPCQLLLVEKTAWAEENSKGSAPPAKARETLDGLERPQAI